MKISADINDAIKLIDGNKLDTLRVDFKGDDSWSAQISLSSWGGCGDMAFDGRFHLDPEDTNGWDCWLEAFGRNTSIRELSLFYYPGEMSVQLYRSIESFHHVLESKTSIHKLSMDTNLFTDDRSLPTLNLVDSQLKESLNVFSLNCCGTITDNQSSVISSVLETMSLQTMALNTFDMDQGSSENSINDSAFRRIILACSQVESLFWVNLCNSPSVSQCSAVAALLGNTHSMLNKLVIDKLETEEGLSKIAAGLTGNTTLRELRIHGCKEKLDSVAKALCDASSIERIRNSNHTLQEIYSSECNKYPFLMDCLELNENANKDEVIREKIAWYYFSGDFDVSPFANMTIKLQPRVLATIEGDSINCQSAIYRMLKSIPELCNISSR